MGLENKAAGERALRKVRLGLEAGRPSSQVCLSSSLVPWGPPVATEADGDLL